MIKVLFACYGSIFKCSGNTYKIDDFIAGDDMYHITTTPLRK